MQALEFGILNGIQESCRCAFLDAVLPFLSSLSDHGEIWIALALVLLLIPKTRRTGLVLALALGLEFAVCNGILKPLIARPRPCDLNDAIQLLIPRPGDDSFPSGHTQNVVGTLGGLARWNKNRVLRIVCITVAALTSLSRMYLGVHTPLDVGVSLVIATVLVFVLYPLVRRCADEPKRMLVLLGVMLALAVAFVCYANFARFPADVDPDNLYEGRKNSFSLLGALLGFFVAYPIERGHIRFDERAAWWVQVLKVVLGLAGLLAIKEGLKALFAAVGFTWVGANAIRYFAVILFAALVWPLCFPLLRRLEKKKS